MSVHPDGEYYENMTSAIPIGLKSQNKAARLNLRGWHTPDFSNLKLMKSIPLFVYGVEMTDGTANGFLDGAGYLGFGHTLGTKFWMKQTTINPVVFDSVDEEHKDNRKIRGQVYDVKVEHLHMLDIFHRNRVSTRRVLRNIILEDCKPKDCRTSNATGFAIQRCFMYVGSKQYWKDYDLRLRNTISYAKKESLKDVPFYEWVNWSQDEDEWGFYGRWGTSSAYDTHVG